VLSSVLTDLADSAGAGGERSIAGNASEIVATTKALLTELEQTAQALCTSISNGFSRVEEKINSAAYHPNLPDELRGLKLPMPVV
jgi:hypothetical protein